MSKFLDDLGTILGDVRKEQSESSANMEDIILQQLALAAQAAGVDIADDTQVQIFIDQVKTIATRGNKLKPLLRKWTPGKSRAAVKVAKSAV